MGKVTVVQYSAGSWDSYEEVPIGVFACDDLEAITQFIKKNQHEDQEFDRISQNIEVFRDEWQVDNPIPERKPHVDIPKWPAGLGMNQVTPEMRAERDRLKKQNEQIDQENEVIYKDWDNARDIATRAYLDSQGITGEISYYTQWTSYDRSQKKYSTYKLETFGKLNQLQEGEGKHG